MLTVFCKHSHREVIKLHGNAKISEQPYEWEYNESTGSTFGIA